MKPLRSLCTPSAPRALPLPSFPSPLFFFTPYPLPSFKSTPVRTHVPLKSISNDKSFCSDDTPPLLSQNQQQQRPRTLFPGGYKRPEIKVPNVVLQLEPDEVLTGGNVLDLIDQAVAKFVGIVLLNDGDASGKSVYDAACVLKSLVKDRAYFLISERVDIAAAVNASGVVLSDQGLPAIVARNTMLDSKSESVVLPLVGRNVQSTEAALDASSSEGADFLICGLGEGKHADVVENSLFANVKLPIFIPNASHGEATSLTVEMSKFLKSGASGLVVSLEELRLFDDVLSQLFNPIYAINKKPQDELERFNNLKVLDASHMVAGFIKLEDREKQLIEIERSVLLEALNVIQKAAPLMDEVSLLIDAVSQLDEPFLLVIVGEFNSGKSSVINALLGKRYLKEGVVPTTNEITFLRCSDLDSEEQQRCERHPDGQYICYLPAPILKEMIIVDTPGTNVILQRQQRLTEEFVPRADLVIFVVSADRPLTESEVDFLRYTQQWKKRFVFVLNKSDLYQNAVELEEAISFIKDNTRKLLNIENVIVYPVSARSTLESKLSASSAVGKDYRESSVMGYHWSNSFDELEKFLYKFLDASTSAGMDRIKLKLETPIAITERLLSACEALLRQDCKDAKQDLTLANEMIDSVKEYTKKMEIESINWRKQTLSLVDATKSRIVELVETTLQLSNFDLVGSYIFKGEKSSTMPVTSQIQYDIVGPALLDARKLLGEYMMWLESNNASEGRQYKESFENRWPSLVIPNTQLPPDTYNLMTKVDEVSLKVVENFSASATSKLFEQEIREVFLGTFGGLGAAGLSASLLTSVLPTTLEDLLALGLCSAGGYIAVANFPSRRRLMIEKVNRVADGLSREIEEAMQKDLSETVGNLETFVKQIGRPYQVAAQHKLDKLLQIQDELSNVQKKLQTLRVEIQNVHVS
ncbi:probable transmembrane GTPase FZO-like, chloroplastic [Mangifera indica]|uniref:probable transmembrane GTPase FZO-like, chloroplastic n=1 Tax=Mangifera indica TaxID=29780 RepID=UPI001CF934A3|nr:probable transmembrane GTPase FZO-like, chloroplastic [Mangifera indica]